MEISPLFPIPEFSAREFNWKYFAGELAWYMDQDCDIDYINKFSNFWKGIANSEGNINSNYGKLLFGDQLVWAYDSLVKDSDSRQAISFVSNPTFQYDGNKDFVCTVYLNFWIRKNELHMKVQMRSNDLFYGYTYDVPFFAVVMQSMWHNLRRTYPDLQLGRYYHCADNIHYYEKHFELGDAILEQKDSERTPVFFYAKYPLFKIENGKIEYTQEALDFRQHMSDIESQATLTKETCKQALKKIFIIQ